MKRYLPIIIFLLALILIVAILSANSLAPISRKASTSVCGTDDRVTYIYPDANGMIDITIGCNSNGLTTISKPGTVFYTTYNMPYPQMWEIHEQYKGQGEVIIEIANSPEMTRRYVITDDQKYLCDLNRDGAVNLIDFAIIANNWMEQL